MHSPRYCLWLTWLNLGLDGEPAEDLKPSKGDESTVLINTFAKHPFSHLALAR